MKRTLASYLTPKIGGKVSVVFNGKLKPVILSLVEVLSDGILATAEGDNPKAYPFTSMQSIEAAPA